MIPKIQVVDGPDEQDVILIMNLVKVGKLTLEEVEVMAVVRGGEAAWQALKRLEGAVQN